MKHAIASLTVLALAATASTHAQTQGKLLPESRPLFAVTDPGGASIMFLYRADRRQFKGPDTGLDVDSQHAALRAGYVVGGFLQPWAQLGWAQADHRDESGDGGIEWSVGATALLLEHALRVSPVVGNQESLRLELDASYEQAESDFENEDFRWSEFNLVPSVRYTRNNAGDSLRQAYHPASVSLQLGLVWSSMDGDYGDTALSERNSLGYLAATDILLGSGWVARLSGTFFDTNDRKILFAAGYHF